MFAAKLRKKFVTKKQLQKINATILITFMMIAYGVNFSCVFLVI